LPTVEKISNRNSLYALDGVWQTLFQFRVFEWHHRYEDSLESWEDDLDIAE
jgi:hypothetical protein